MRQLLLVCALAGCIRPDLVPCGDLACAPDAICVANTVCATDDQLAACADKVEGALCVSASGNGSCRLGVCAIDRCGDGIVDPTEVCDDGNLTPGDGCRQDCRSDETCGNGVLDLDETCDCGTSAAALAPGCTTPNSDDPTAQCDLACTRTCGDGVVTGSEQCDGSTIPFGCDAFGFYRGDASCTSYCALDTATCSGRCGDGVVDVEYNEQCDNTTPSGTCLSFGRDYGVLGCGSFCGPDIIGSCGFFTGWVNVINSTHDDPRALAVNRRGSLGLRAISTTSALVRWDNVSSSRVTPGWTIAAATPSLLLAFGPTSYGWFDGTWHDQQTAVGPGAIATTSTNLAYVVAADCAVATLVIQTGVLTSIATPFATACTAAVTIDDQLYVAAGSAGVLRWDGTAWTTVTTTPTTTLARGRAHHLIAGGLDIDVSTDPVTVTTWNGGVTDIDGVSAAAWDPDPEDPDDGTNVTLTAGIGTRIDNFERVSYLMQSEDGALIAGGKGVFRFETGLLSVGGFAPGTTLSQITVLADGAVAFCGSFIGPGTRPFAGSCVKLLGDPRGPHRMLGRVGLATSVYRWDEPTGAYVQELASAGDLIGSASDAFATSSSVLHHLSGTTWSAVQLPTGCNLRRLAANQAKVVAAMDCSTGGTTIFQWSGTSFTQTAQFAMLGNVNDVALAPDGTLFLSSDSSNTTHRVDGSSLVRLGIRLSPMAAVSASDVFGRYPLEPGLHHVVADVDSQLNLPTATGPIAATRDLLYVWDPSAQQLVTIPRMRRRLPASGL